MVGLLARQTWLDVVIVQLDGSDDAVSVVQKVRQADARTFIAVFADGGPAHNGQLRQLYFDKGCNMVRQPSHEIY